jgi:hypothetical protein
MGYRKKVFFFRIRCRDELAGRGRLTSGGGYLAVVPIDRGDQSGSNGGG